MYASLADFLEDLEQQGQLARVEAEVDPAGEIAEITRRVAQRGGPALLFERVAGCSVPVVTNLLGSPVRLAKALGVGQLAELTERVERSLQQESSGGWLDSLRRLQVFASSGKLAPRVVNAGPVQQVVRLRRDVDLHELPMLSGGGEPAALHGAAVYTRSPQSRQRNVGAYPVVRLDAQQAVILWRPHHGAARHWCEYQRLGQPMPVAVAIGGDPVCTYMAHAPLPAGADECLLGGMLRGRPVELIRARSIDLEVPADAELVLEGEIDVARPPVEIAATAFDSDSQPTPRRGWPMQVTAVTHRAKALWCVSVPHDPPCETTQLHLAHERILLPLLRAVVPELADLSLSADTAADVLACASFHKTYTTQAHKVAAALRGSDPLSRARLLILLDAEADPRDPRDVLARVAAHVDPSCDLIVHRGPADGRNDSDDDSCQLLTLDATRKPLRRTQPPEAPPAGPTIREVVEGRWARYGIDAAPPAPVAGGKSGPKR